jgi:hypothetical protein
MDGSFSRLILLPSILLIQACTSSMSIDEKGRTVAHHFGYVRVIKPPLLNNENINVTGVKTVGLSIRNGITLGYEENKIISVPLDCRVIVVVQNREQLEEFANIINDLKGKEICATVTP